MKVKLLKKIRLNTLKKYDVRNWSYIPSCEDKPWRIGSGVDTTLAFHAYANKEEAIEALKLLWHDEAKKYLWNHRDERKRKKYYW